MKTHFKAQKLRAAGTLFFLGAKKKKKIKALQSARLLVDKINPCLVPAENAVREPALEGAQPK